jgi:AcrR family transcriptional regulator
MPVTRKTTNERRKEILQAALEIIDEEGIHSMTLRRIADSIGVSEAALFRHFESKEDIMDSLASIIFDRSVVELELPEGTGPPEAIRKFLRERIGHFKDNPLITTMLFREEVFDAYPNIRERFEVFKNDVRGNLSGLVEAGVQNGDLRSDLDPDVTALMITGSLRAIVMDWRDSGFTGNLEGIAEKLEQHLSMMMEGK